MSTDQTDDFDDIPTFQPLPPIEPSRDELRARYFKPGFGFWMAVVWCVIYVVVMQVLAAFACGIPVILIAMAIDAANGQAPGDPAAWMKSETGATAMMIVLVLSHLVGLLFGFIILRWQVGRSWMRRIAINRLPSPTHIVLVPIGVAAMMALSAAIEVPIMRYIPSIQDLLNAAAINFDWPGIEMIEPLLKKTPWSLAIFAIAILPGLNEELWCRGFLGQGLSMRYKTWGVVLITSFLFGCIHLEPRQGVNAMFLGAAIHGSYLATRSLWVPIFVHMAHNGLAAIHMNEQIGVPVLTPIEDVLARSPVLLVFSALLLFSAAAFALSSNAL